MPLVFVSYCTIYFYHKDCFSLIVTALPPGYLPLELSSPETLESLFSNTHLTRKLIRKVICNMEGREPSLVFPPSFQITSLGLGVLMG